MKLEGVAELGVPGLALSFLLALVPLWIFHDMRLPLARQLVGALARMVLQLSALGLVLGLLFRVDHPLPTVAWLLVMQGAAAFTILRRTQLKLPGLPLLLLAVLCTGGGGVLAFCLLVVVRPEPLLGAAYAIPLGGMILGNSMNGITLALERQSQRLMGAEGRREWDLLLGLGTSVEEARRRFSNGALRMALLPTLNTTATIGLVSIPGMTTGQLLGGSSPVTAIEYQMMIMLAILASVSLSAWMALRLLHWRLVDGEGLFRHEGE